MMITRNNYEAYMLDLMEGTLTPQEEAALHLFLEENPDLDETIPTVNTLASNDSQFEFKESLIYEEVNEENRSFFFISFAEGLLNDEQKDQLNKFLQIHPHYQKEVEQFQRASLTAENIKFENKSALIFEKEKGLIISLRSLSYAAAVIAVFIFSYATIQLLKTDIDPLYEPTELALDKILAEPEQENSIEDVKLTQPSSMSTTQIAKKGNNVISPSAPKIIIDNSEENVDPNIAHNPIKEVKSNDSIPGVKPSITPSNDIALNSHSIQSAAKPTPKAPTIGELIVQSAKDKLYNNPNAPEKDEFDSEIAALASAGMSAVSNREQYINRTVNDSKKTKVSIGVFSFERVKH